MKSIMKSKVLFIVKILLALAIMYFIFKRIDYHAVISNIASIHTSTLIILFLLSVIKIIIQVINWGKYLRINPDYKPQTKEIISSYFAGDALRFIIPGGYGALGKMYFVNNHKRDTFISIGVEKFLQIWSTLSFAVFAAIFYFKEINLLLKLSVTAFVWFSPFLLSFVSSIPKLRFAHKYSSSYNKFIPAVLARQILLMIITIIQYYVIMSNFTTVHFLHVFIAVPLILSANLIPITYAGLGLRETFAIKVLHQYGIYASVSVTCSLIVFAISNIPSALLGAYFIAAKKHEYKSLSDIGSPELQSGESCEKRI